MTKRPRITNPDKPPVRPKPPVLGPEAKLERYQDRDEFTSALSEFDPKKPRPTAAELGKILTDYLACEKEEERHRQELTELGKRKTELCRTWLRRRGTPEKFRLRNETWAVQSIRWGGLMFRRFKPPVKVLELPDSAIAGAEEPAREAPKARKARRAEP